MWSFSWLVSFPLTQSPVQSFALNEWVVAEALGRSALPGGFLTLRGKSQGVPRGIRIGGSGAGRGGAVVLWLAGRAGPPPVVRLCTRNLGTVALRGGAGREGVGPADRPAPGDTGPRARPHTPSASGVCVPDGDGRVQGVRLVWAGGSAQCTCRSLTLGGVGRSSLTFEIAILFDQSEVGKQQGLSCPWVHLRLG